MTLEDILAIVIAFLLGSIPFAYLVTRVAAGKDIRKLGNRNPGAGNVIREVGIVPGLGVLLLDLGKGVLAIFVSRWLGASQIVILACGFAAVAGHMWSVLLGFKGGGGAATTLGVFSGLVPREFSISFAIMVVTALLTRSFGFSVGVGLLPLPLILWAFGADTSLIIYSVALPLLLVFRNSRKIPELVRKLSGPDWKKVIIDRRFMSEGKDRNDGSGNPPDRT